MRQIVPSTDRRQFIMHHTPKYHLNNEMFNTFPNITPF